MTKTDKNKTRYENLKADIVKDIMKLLLTLEHPAIETKWGVVTIITSSVMGKTLCLFKDEDKTDAKDLPIETLVNILQSLEYSTLLSTSGCIYEK